MISYRMGQPVAICDGCYRPKRTGEQGWEHSDQGGFPASTARRSVKDRIPPEPQPIPTLTVEQPEQGLDYCPRCSAERQSSPQGTLT